jgi:hypothetical protein
MMEIFQLPMLTLLLSDDIWELNCCQLSSQP